MNEKAMMHVIRQYENKLREILSPEDFGDFVVKCARESFKIEIEEMEAGEFRDFCLDNFDGIVGLRE